MRGRLRCVVLLVVVIGTAAAADRCVVYISATTGVNQRPCGDVASPCADLNFGLDTATAACDGPAITLHVLPGQYGPTSCGLNATNHNLNIIGAGSGDCVIDCGGVDRVLATTASVSMGGITLRGGRVTLVYGAMGGWDDVHTGGGGAAVWVAWPRGARHVAATFTDVAFVDNAVTASLTAASSYFYGGGAVFVTGEDVWNATVVFADCTADDNHVTLAGGVPAPLTASAEAIVDGGAFGVLIGSFRRNGAGQNSSAAVVSVTDVVVRNCSVEGFFAQGGGIGVTFVDVSDGAITMDDVSVSGSAAMGADGAGGGVCIGALTQNSQVVLLPGIVALSNVALVGNAAGYAGGGMYVINELGNLTLSHLTVSGNTLSTRGGLGAGLALWSNTDQQPESPAGCPSAPYAYW